MKEEKYTFWETKLNSDSKIRILSNDDFYKKYFYQHHYLHETDEDKLDKIDIQTIERYLRKKKLDNIKDKS